MITPNWPSQNKFVQMFAQQAAAPRATFALIWSGCSMSGQCLALFVYLHTYAHELAHLDHHAPFPIGHTYIAHMLADTQSPEPKECATMQSTQGDSGQAITLATFFPFWIRSFGLWARPGQPPKQTCISFIHTLFDYNHSNQTGQQPSFKGKVYTFAYSTNQQQKREQTEGGTALHSISINLAQLCARDWASKQTRESGKWHSSKSFKAQVNSPRE